MTVVGTTKERDERIFGTIVRKKLYKGDDKTLTSKGEITAIPPEDVGVRALIGKFSTLDLSKMLPEQRELFLKQMRYEISLTGKELNDYLSERYSNEDLRYIWELQRGPKRKNTKRKQSNSQRARKRKLSPEAQAAKLAKFHATIARNRENPDYISYKQLQKEFQKRQKLLAERYDIHVKSMVENLSEGVINKRVAKVEKKWYRENQKLKEFIKLNGLSLPDSAKEKARRAKLRKET